MLRGGAGNDRLEGGAGNDTLYGDGGNNEFVFGPGGGADKVMDFAAGRDVIRIVGSGYGNFGDLLTAGGAVSQVGADTVIDLGGGDSITLQAVSMSKLGEASFLFA